MSTRKGPFNDGELVWDDYELVNETAAAILVTNAKDQTVSLPKSLINWTDNKDGTARVGAPEWLITETELQ